MKSSGTMQEFEKLKKLRILRGQYKGTITRIENFVNDPITFAPASVDILEARKEKLISTLKDYENVQMDILCLDEMDNDEGHNTLLHPMSEVLSSDDQQQPSTSQGLR